MATPDDDPEVTDIDELHQVEHARGPSSRRVRRGSTALIALVVLVLAALGAASLWILKRG